MTRVRTKSAKKQSNPFLGYPEHLIITGTFSSMDDSIDQENRTPPPVGSIVSLAVDDSARVEEGDDLEFKVVAVRSEPNGGVTNITLQLHSDKRIAISR